MIDNEIPPKTQENWAEKEEKRQNPNHWVEKLRPQIMERIKHYENFLEKWGIIAQTGIEQEFYPIPKDGTNVGESIALLGEKPIDFKNSPFIEKIYHDNTYRSDPMLSPEQNLNNQKNMAKATLMKVL